MANCCTLFNVGHFSKKSHAPRTERLVEVQNVSLGTHRRKFLKDTPENLSIQTLSPTCAHNTRGLSNLYFSAFEKFFLTQPRIPLSF